MNDTDIVDMILIKCDGQLRDAKYLTVEDVAYDMINFIRVGRKAIKGQQEQQEKQEGGKV